MTKLIARIALLSTAVCAALPANASIIYRIEALKSSEDIVGSVQFTLSDYITSYAVLSASQADYCTINKGLTCGSSFFWPYPTRGTSFPYDLLQFTGNDAFNNVYGPNYAFAPGTLGRAGAYDNVPNRDGERARLTIIDTDAPAVPEPGTWLMMIGGFGLIGGVLRRRERVTLRLA